MIQKIKDFIALRKTKKKEKQRLEKMQRYYTMLKEGATFVQFVQNDLNSKGTELNRKSRRRLQKTVLKGEFTPELVEHYKQYIDKVLKTVDEKMNPPKEIDGAKYYEQLKKEMK